MIVILDNVRSMHNVGSIFRTADAAGAEKIYLCGITPEPTDRLGRPRQQVTKVALGAEKNIPWEKAASALRLIGKLKKEGYAIVALEQAEGSVPYDSSEMRKLVSGTDHAAKIALVVGNEVDGVASAVSERCDVIAEIPMAGKKESLNVAVAFGIMAFHLRSEEKSAARKGPPKANKA